MASGARILSIPALLLAIFLLFTGTSFAAPTFSIESTEIHHGTTDVTLDFNISNVDLSDDVDSVTFDLTLSDGLSLTDVIFVNVPDGWTPAAQLDGNRFGATDGWPITPLSSDLLPFAQLEFSIDPTYSVAGNIFDIDFAFSEVVDSNGSPVDSNLVAGQVQVSAAPLPSALILFGCGLMGMIGFRRKLRS